MPHKTDPLFRSVTCRLLPTFIKVAKCEKYEEMTLLASNLVTDNADRHIEIISFKISQSMPFEVRDLFLAIFFMK